MANLASGAHQEAARAMTVGFLVADSRIAPALGHVLVHAEATRHGAEMPPEERPTATTERAGPASAGPGLRPVAAA